MLPGRALCAPTVFRHKVPTRTRAMRPFNFLAQARAPQPIDQGGHWQ